MASSNIPSGLPSDAGAVLKGAPNPTGQRDSGGLGENDTKPADASMSTFDDGSDDE